MSATRGSVIAAAIATAATVALLWPCTGCNQSGPGQSPGNAHAGVSATSPDGVVSQVLPDTQGVYLRLIRPEHVKLGMRYAVFGKDKPVAEGGEGKATVEISDVEYDSIQAKIIRSVPGDPIKPGDLAVSLAPAKKQFRFLVFGLFDLNGSGTFAPDGKARMEELLRNWGGKIVEDIGTADFLVLGEQQQTPPKPPAGASPTSQAEYERKSAECKRWVELRDQADRKGIPILSLPTFFIGPPWNYDHAPGWDKRVRPGDDYLPRRTTQAD